MRVTSQFLFDNFKSDHNKVLKELEKLTTQVSSGQKIQNSYENSAVYTDILRFESQENELSSIKKRTIQAKSLADASDSALGEFTQTLRDFKTKLISASNGSLNSDNRQSIATELEEQKKHMISLANSQMNGQYLFSGSSVNVKPVDSDGEYRGNGESIMTLVGNGVSIQSNIDGKSLFLGDDLNINKSIQTNVKLTNQISDEKLTSSSSIREMVGDDDDISTNDKSVHFFISGTNSNGKAFKDVVEIQPDAKIEDLLEKIKDNFGDDVVVELNGNGNISITDGKSGYSQMDFKMVGVQGITNPLETDLSSVTGDKIISFTKSNFESVDASIDESLQMDKFYFEKNGGRLEGNVALIADGAFAANSTKLSDLMGVSSMPNKTFEMSITDINGVDRNIELDLSATSTFSVDGTSYSIFNADETPTDKDEFTMGQLNNIISMSLSGELPLGASASDFNTAIKSANKIIDVDINQNGNLEINDKSDNLSNIKFSMYDKDANDFSKTSTPSLSFMSNNAVTVSKSNMNFFDELDDIIASVRDGVINLGADANNIRSISIQNAIGKLDQMNSHFNNAQATIGVRSKSLNLTEQKVSAMEVNVKQLKAETTEVDMAETILKLNQITLNYEAMLQTITKVNSLSLLNYLR
jgi:flagellar hook-associated protein 3 FlgL